MSLSPTFTMCPLLSETEGGPHSKLRFRVSLGVIVTISRLQSKISETVKVRSGIPSAAITSIVTFVRHPELLADSSKYIPGFDTKGDTSVLSKSPGPDHK